MTLSTGGSRQLTLKYKGAWGGSFHLLGPCYMPSTGLIALKAPPLLILTGISEVRIMPILLMRILRLRSRGL